MSSTTLGVGAATRKLRRLLKRYKDIKVDDPKAKNFKEDIKRLSDFEKLVLLSRADLQLDSRLELVKEVTAKKISIRDFVRFD